MDNKGNCWWHFRFYLHHYIINWFAKFYDPKANEWEMEGWWEETSLQAWFDIGRLRKEVDKGTTLLSSFRLVDFQDDKTDLPKLNERFDSGFVIRCRIWKFPLGLFSCFCVAIESNRDKGWLNEPEWQTLIEIVKPESTIMHFWWTLHFLYVHNANIHSV